MAKQPVWKGLLRVGLRPAFALALFLSQFTATRGTLFTKSVPVLVLGVVLLGAGVWLWLNASRHLQRARSEGALSTTGPYRFIRHPIYASIYLLSVGLGCLFFAWAWFGVLVVFAPLWVLECLEEERELEALYGLAYREYQRQTGMFLPQ